MGKMDRQEDHQEDSRSDGEMMEISVEHLLGKHVVDSDGKKLGRIHEITAERAEDSCTVNAYLVGGRAMIVRIARWAVPNSLSGKLESKLFRPYWIAWDKMDLSDPDHPRATVTRTELELTR
jgi:hypothetical protein